MITWTHTFDKNFKYKTKLKQMERKQLKEMRPKIIGIAGKKKGYKKIEIDRRRN